MHWSRWWTILNIGTAIMYKSSWHSLHRSSWKRIIVLISLILLGMAQQIQPALAGLAPCTVLQYLRLETKNALVERVPQGFDEGSGLGAGHYLVSAWASLRPMSISLYGITPEPTGATHPSH